MKSITSSRFPVILFPLCFGAMLLDIKQVRSSATAQHGTPGLRYATDNSERATVTFMLEEELPIGTLIGSLVERLPESGLQPNSAVPNSILFSPLEQERFVRLNRTTGQLVVRSRIDREALCDQVGTCCPASPLSAKDPGGAFSAPGGLVDLSSGFPARSPSCALRMLVMDQRSREPSGAGGKIPNPHFVQVIIYVIDVNDNPPHWSPDSLELEIPEHTPVGTTFQLPEASDPDQGPQHTTVHYHLMDKFHPKANMPQTDRHVVGDLFSIINEVVERPFGLPYKFNLQLKVNGDLDREKRDSYRLLLNAVDGSNNAKALGRVVSPAQTGTLNILIKVTDINDQAPYFIDSSPTVEINENIAIGSRIFTMTAKDDDPSDANRLVYRFASTATGEVLKTFNISDRTGAITLMQEMNYETAPLLPDGRTRGSAESMGSSLSAFGLVTSRERKVGYLIPVRVTDGIHITEAELRIRIRNINDNPPNITIQSHLRRWRGTNELLLPEDAPVGQMVATITVEDADERWSDAQDEDSSGRFENEAKVLAQCVTSHPFFVVQPLMSTTSRRQYMLLTTRKLDRESKSTHTVTINCHDSGQPVLSRRAHVIVHLEDLNDSPPVFTQAVYNARIAEGLPTNSPIARVQATDADIGYHALLQYSLAGSVEHLDMVNLDPRTGQITSAVVFDREKLDSINFTVLAHDCAVPNPTTAGLVAEVGELAGNSADSCTTSHSAQASLVVTIDDVNDCAPEFEQSNYEFLVKEGQRPQQSIGIVRAVDADAEMRNSRIQYSISDMDVRDGVRASTLFAITSNGELFTRNAPIDRERTPILSFTVIATDYGSPPLSAYATVIVRVEDVNDHTPAWVFPAPSSTGGSAVARVNMSRHAIVGRVVAHLKAVDADSGLYGEVEYSILKGNELEYFALDKNTGTLYLAKPLNLEMSRIQSPPLAASGGSTNETLSSSERRPSFDLPEEGSFSSLPQSFVLALKASDQGKPPRSNTTILKIDVSDGNRLSVGPPVATSAVSYGHLRGGSTKKLAGSGMSSPQMSGTQRQQQWLDGGMADRDLMIIVAMIVVALVISLALIAAIVFLRCRQTGEDRGGVRPQEAMGLRKKFEGLSCLSKNRQTVGFVLNETECNPNFDEHVNPSQYGSSRGTPLHGLRSNQNDDLYGHLSAGVMIPTSTLGSCRKVQYMTTADSDIPGLPRTYMGSPQAFPAHQLLAYEGRLNPEDAASFSSSSAAEPKTLPVFKTYDGVICRIPFSDNASPNAAAVGVDRMAPGYMTLSPDLFKPDVYRKLKYVTAGRVCKNESALDWDQPTPVLGRQSETSCVEAGGGGGETDTQAAEEMTAEQDVMILVKEATQSGSHTRSAISKPKTQETGDPPRRSDSVKKRCRFNPKDVECSDFLPPMESFRRLNAEKTESDTRGAQSTEDAQTSNELGTQPLVEFA
uniref:Cadherin domain-containing protein n=1 Tax=Schistocephalus solidus TaxID=70667 RepID=A0A0X3Q1N5_SCHSO